MMDRFKFRLFVTENEAYPDKVGYVNEESFCILPNGEESFFDADYDFAECIIEQATGLKDKNGKLIYEGDIIREISKKEPEWEEYVTEVKWKVCGFNIYDAADFYFEVIGNIHENKELLDE